MINSSKEGDSLFVGLTRHKINVEKINDSVLYIICHPISITLQRMFTRSVKKYCQSASEMMDKRNIHQTKMVFNVLNMYTILFTLWP